MDTSNSPPQYGQLTWDEKGQPVSKTFDDIYYSAADGLAESRYVFIEQNQLSERFEALAENRHFVIGETGFGTGLNFLATWELWSKRAPDSAHLYYLSTEKFPILLKDLQTSAKRWPELEEYSQQLIKHYQKNIAGLPLPNWQALRLGNITLLLILDDAADGFTKLLSHPHPDFSRPYWQGVDAWFLDGFAPAKNPEMWTEALFSSLAQLSTQQTTLSSFTAAGVVKRGLAAAGFTIKKVPGFGSKRDMITAGFTQFTPQQPVPPKTKLRAPWSVRQSTKHLQAGQTVAVIGAGLAGCHSAYALAQRGLKVKLIDRHQDLAQGTSGNPQGILYAKLSGDNNPLCIFNLACFNWAQSFYEAFWQQCLPYQGQQCGVLQLSTRDKLIKDHQKLADEFKYCHWLQYVNAEAASSLAGVPLKDAGLYLPRAGWLNPYALCQWLSQHPNIQFIPNTQVNQLTKDAEQWRLTGTNQWQLEADGVVIANAQDAKALSLCNWLPLKPIRGQVSYLPQNPITSNLNTVVCGDGYIAPAIRDKGGNMRQTMGASYKLNSQDWQLSAEEHAANLNQLQAIIPSLGDLSITEGRVGFRCTTPDYLPLAGPLPVEARFKQQYAPLYANAKCFVAEAGIYHDSLFLNIGHGSRGLAYTPLCADIIAAQLCGTPPALSSAMLQALNPARFLIRDISRSRSRQN